MLAAQGSALISAGIVTFPMPLEILTTNSLVICYSSI